MKNYSQEMAFGRDIVTRAMSLCRKVQERWQPGNAITKTDQSPVTVADFAVQALIHQSILAHDPDAVMISEESAETLRKDASLRDTVIGLVHEYGGSGGDSEILDAIDAGSVETGSPERFWTLDPIDGTKGFMRGDQYAIALALIEKGEVVLGILGCPAFPNSDRDKTGALFYATRTDGAYRVDPSGASVQIFTDANKKPEQAVFCESAEPGHANRDAHARIASQLGISSPSLRMDSQAKYAALASGMASIYLRLPKSAEYREKIWDHAAGIILVEAAGGRVTDFGGNRPDFTRGRKMENNIGILASNGHLHDAALCAIQVVAF